MTSTSVSILLAIVAIFSSVPRALAMDAEHGYLCNLCHSRKNEYPYPPPSAEQAIVRFPKASHIEEFGMPWDRGITCIDAWNTVLDFQNPKVVDEPSCRSMAEVYAPQCCNDRTVSVAATVVETEPEISLETGATTGKHTDDKTSEMNSSRVEQKKATVVLSSQPASRHLRGHP
mmetsp:Transcript_18172/g.41715  ORF Transcript_18172/g.41715 Transcript_18172/m.41715 type:complete len:174 (-) Transcript_18172:86-607(-)|eukprot:CAMPEP_0172384576 /NCGR_PEP_ID=MMETSP1061-20121228/2313_1 /TAXON_ID=37318 /ORGANISM="Pseudo-nitzschia pungens, Strain cf. pungens" /LENGTH=173 /DNA_ID=CAMNT_0013113243 /DNA_START=241 /DNA_END=762 /DNA_ORIENTATION=-